MLCIGGVLVGFSIGLESARPICRLASLSDCAIDSVSCWAGSFPCTLGTDCGWSCDMFVTEVDCV